MTMEMTSYGAPHVGDAGDRRPGPGSGRHPHRALDAGTPSRVTIELVGHGVGKLLVPLLVRPETRKGLPRNLSLEERVEAR
jgi:hypothetical protein